LWLYPKSERTRKAYLSDLKKFLDFDQEELGGKALAEIPLYDLQRFQEFLSEPLAYLASLTRDKASLSGVRDVYSTQQSGAKTRRRPL
jgi:hypothetical protein